MQSIDEVRKLLFAAIADYERAKNAGENATAAQIERETIVPLETRLAFLALTMGSERIAELDRLTADMEQALSRLQRTVDRFFLSALLDAAPAVGVKTSPSVPNRGRRAPERQTDELRDAAPAIGSERPVAAVPFDVEKRDADLSNLHPAVRRRVKAIQKALDDESIPMRVFEAFRTPERQAHLYAQGRTRPGRRVTNATAWESYHQYGLAADFVRFEDGNWNWNDSTPGQKREWDRFHEIARANGLEPLSWERPHVQIMGVTLTSLTNGDYPEGGDESWAENLSAAIARWPGANAPPAPNASERPPLQTADVLLGRASTPRSGGWRSMFGGDQWRFDERGVYTRKPDGSDKLWRSTAAPTTVQEIVARFGQIIGEAADRFSIAPELIVMTIATETAAFRANGFTGPSTFRWEVRYLLNATGDPTIDGKKRGDYSAGPMQVMSDTARWMNQAYLLGFGDRLPFFAKKPSPVPAELGLYEAEICIMTGAAYIRENLEKTGGDPLLVAAAYNAGGLYPSSENHWRIRSTSNHLDRAAEWYGDACSIMSV